MLAASPYQIMVQDGRVHDIDALDFDRWYVQASPSVSSFILIANYSLVVQVRVYFLSRTLPNIVSSHVERKNYRYRVASWSICCPSIRAKSGR